MDADKGHRPRFAGLQAARVLACVSVLIFHAEYVLQGKLYPAMPVWRSGVAGVDVFFVLSGFVMAYTSVGLARKPDGWKTFAARRLERIVPMYWLVLGFVLATMLVHPSFYKHVPNFAGWVVSSFLFVPHIDASGTIFPILSVGWTLNFEMLFYCLFTLGLLLRANLFAAVGMPLAVLSLLSIAKQPGWPAVQFYCDPIGLEFLAGMGIARLAAAGRTVRPALAWDMLAAAAVLIAWYPLRTYFNLRFLVFGVPAILIVYALVSLEPHLHSVPRAVLFLADASYVLYLVHVPIILGLAGVFARLHMTQPLLVLPVLLTVPIAVACVLRLCVEAPLLRFLHTRRPAP